MNAQRLFTVLAALVMMAPVGAATWYAYGTYEPDTIYDFQSGYQWRDASQDPNADKLYFNAFPTENSATVSVSGCCAANPNNGQTLGSRVLVPGFRQYEALLGLWKDCNGDQVVGLAETALVVYRVELLTESDICPVGSVHNDGQWIWEYIPVGYEFEEEPNLHPKQIVDEDARVWGDFGLPGAPPAGTCPIAPPPHGTTSGSGWLIRYADCFIGKQGTGAVNSVDSSGSLGLRFEDQNNPQQSSSLLNQHFPESLFGNPETGETGALQLDSEEDGGEEEAAFTTWDCSARGFEVKDPTGMAPQTISVDDPTYDGETGVLGGNYGKVDENLTDDGAYAWVATPSADPAVNPSGSFADGINGTMRGVHTGGDIDYDASAWGGTCETEGDEADNTYQGVHETAFFYTDGANNGGTQVVGKIEADMAFTYDNGGESDGAVGQVLGTSTPGNYGIAAISPRWEADTVYSTTPQSISRQTLQPQSGLYLSFYAKVGGTTLAEYEQPAGSGVYGSEACGDADEGVVNQWDCDPTHWYIGPGGEDTSVNFVTIRVGETYQFRDIDCDDGQVKRGTPVYASLVDLTDAGPCADAPN